MTNLELVLKYLDIYFSGRNLHKMKEILADDLIFEGPLFKFDSAKAYIDSLISDPPIGCEYRMIRVFESLYTVNLIYEFTKDGMCTPMSQLFEMADGKITRILLIFDTASFT